MNRFGKGPHFVRITVEMPVIDKNARGSDEGFGLESRSFVVQLAPLDVMSHSVYFFLEMVQLRMWDNTFFYHHEKIEHVLSALPMNYQTGTLTFHDLAFLGRQSLSFPEFSMEYQHEKYTIGFANMGPSFYLNTRDNLEVHGPGGQGHHLLPLDADPCFGRVVEGASVVDDLIQLGMLLDDGGRSSTSTHNEVPADGVDPFAAGGADPLATGPVGPHAGAQFETHTRIVSITLDDDYRSRAGFA
jgi:cyclophilin family peptidyl-prolyl cis-trans isomerase